MWSFEGKAQISLSYSGRKGEHVARSKRETGRFEAAEAQDEP
jgi:hypothetical protein